MIPKSKILYFGSGLIVLLLLFLVYSFSLSLNVKIFILETKLNSKKISEKEVSLLLDSMLRNNNVNITNEKGVTPLMYASFLGDRNLAKILINRGARINAKDKEGNSPITYAVLGEERKMITFLKEKNASINEKNIKGRSALAEYVDRKTINSQNTISEENKKTIDIILKEGGYINSQDEEGNTIIMVAAKNNNESFLKYLYEKGANPRTRNKKNDNLVDFLIEQNNLPLFKVALEIGENINDEDGNGMLSIHKSIKQKRAEFSKILINRGADMTKKDNFGSTAIKYAVLNEDREIIKYYINYKDVEAKDDLVDAVFQFSYMDKDYFSTRDKLGSPFLIRAAFTGYDVGIKLAYLLGADVNITDNSGMTALMVLAEKNNVESALFLINKGADINKKTSTSYKSAIIFASQNLNIEIAKLLLEKGANTNDTDSDGSTPLHFCVNYNLYQLSENRSVFSEKHEKVYEFAKILLDYGANINYAIKEKYTVLGYVVEMNDFESTDFFLQEGADPNIGETLFSANDLEIMKKLINHGANINIRNSHKETLVYNACNRNNENMVKFLIESGADLNSTTKDEYDYTDLMKLAAKEKFKEAKWLIKYGAEVNYRNKNKETVLGIVKVMKASWEEFRDGKVKVTSSSDPEGKGGIQLGLQHLPGINAFINYLVSKGAIE
jgi:ankyrin repeat protein